MLGIIVAANTIVALARTPCDGPSCLIKLKTVALEKPEKNQKPKSDNLNFTYLRTNL